MEDRNKVIKYVADNYQEFLSISAKICHGKEKGEELLQSLIIYIHDNYSINPFLKAMADNSIKYFIVFLLKQEHNSKTSYFWRQENRFSNKRNCFFERDKDDDYYNDNAEEDEKIEEFNQKDFAKKTVDAVNNILCKGEENILPWEIGIYKMYYFENKTYRQIRKEVLIPLSSLHRAVHRVNDLVIKKIKDYGRI